MAGISALKYRRSPVLNEYDVAIIGAYLAASGKAASRVSTYSSVGADHVFTWMT